MTRYVKPKKTTTSQDEVAPALRIPAQKIKERVERALGDNQPLNKRDVYLLTRVKLAARLLASTDQAEKDKIFIELGRLEGEGYRLKFDKNDIWGANAAALLIREEGKLPDFIRQTERRG